MIKLQINDTVHDFLNVSL